MTFHAEPLKPKVGAEVVGGRSIIADENFAAQCVQALEDRVVLLFRKLGLNDAEQLDFTRRLGSIVNITKRVHGGNTGEVPDVYKVTLTENPTPEYVTGTFFWHMDGTTTEFPPPRASVLSARKLAPKGGQTEFCNTQAAFEALPVSEQRELEGLRVLHDNVPHMMRVTESPTEADLERWSTARSMGFLVPKEHPLVRTFPNGKKALLIGSSALRIIGMPFAEGHALLTRLVEFASQPEFCYRHEWQLGDLVIWDNYRALHRVIPYSAESGRMMHRTTIQELA